MVRMIGVGLFLMALVVGLVACTMPPIFQTPAEDQHEPGEESGDEWLIYELKQAGLSVQPDDELSQPFFAVKGQIVTVNGGDVQVFDFGSPSEAALAAAQISPSGTAIGLNQVSWMATPHFFQKGSLIALYVGDDTQLLGQLQLVLGDQIAGGISQ